MILERSLGKHTPTPTHIILLLKKLKQKNTVKIIRKKKETKEKKELTQELIPAQQLTLAECCCA